MLKGAAMGVAEAVPGVSGGTIALITGVYERFIAALAKFKPSLFGYLRKRDFRGLWLEIDGMFLFSLGFGMLVSLFTVLNLMHWLIETAAPMVWSFFMGVILVSIWFLSKGRQWLIKDYILLCLGLIISISLIIGGTSLGSEVNEVTPDAWVLVLGGVIAISAMLLPGISGSFLLVLMGVYQPVLDAVHDRNFVVVFWVALGCAIGILTTSRLLKWLLTHWHDRVISFMLGFVAGALLKVWPWQFSGRWLLPEQYAAITNSPSWIVGVSLSVVMGGALVLLMHRYTAK
jgi:putative membrane protein